jgi:hypothetical protein
MNWLLRVLVGVGFALAIGAASYVGNLRRSERAGDLRFLT